MPFSKLKDSPCECCLSLSLSFVVGQLGGRLRLQFACSNFYMFLNREAYRALNIFESETHPSIHSDRSKEGISLFGILNTTKTFQGRQLMKSWFMRPLLDIGDIEERYNVVEFFCAPLNQMILKEIETQLKQFTNIPASVVLSFLMHRFLTLFFFLEKHRVD